MPHPPHHELYSQLSAAQKRTLAALTTPQRIQAFLDDTPPVCGIGNLSTVTYVSC
jgi:hypothetical protein